jgi:hypothetical protein
MERTSNWLAAQIAYMDLTGQGSNHDLADRLDRVTDQIGRLGISREPMRAAATTIEPSRRGFGAITVAVATVLGSAGEMRRTRDVYRAIEGLLGESVSSRPSRTASRGNQQAKRRSSSGSVEAVIA